ncbi:MAG: tRNA uridine-5-carboxymethylaminomethyl(34) synthesis GTPase MnmE [Desulfuromonas sp.]|nr:MAG: tRNA uridine-5-carboxymethylaminomethyl(34) synthesis GTPase MnmE [Desulfuromonas sp.]
MNTKDTIIAPATAPGEGGIAIVRISGSLALSALKRHFHPTSGVVDLNSHRLYHGRFYADGGQPVDEVMAVYMAAPHSYTCDDVVEIHSHGSQQVVKTILNIYQNEGIRLAMPGEFTYRAFLNGRLDLSQAEAVARLISSHSDNSRKLALAQVDGGLSREISSFAAEVKHTLVYVEAWIDFPEEDLPTEDIAQLATAMRTVCQRIEALTQGYDSGRILTEGASILLVGQPNVGKSSLLNCLLGEDRAIVTNVPGTTRDLLEEGLSIDGIPVRLIDTAGLRESQDSIEREGIRRAEQKLSSADLVLFLVDGSREVDDQDMYVHDRCLGLPTILIRTKQDVGLFDQDLSFTSFPVCSVSARTGEGVESLKQMIAEHLGCDSAIGSETVMLTERRHFEALIFAQKALIAFIELLDRGETLDLLAVELRDTLYHLGQISGETTTESLLDDIFSGFCIGK